MKLKYAAVKLDHVQSPVEVVGYWNNEQDAKAWASRNWDMYKIVPYWRISQ